MRRSFQITRLRQTGAKAVAAACPFQLPRLLAVIAAVILLASLATAQDALTFYKNYFVTGDYVVGGVGLRGGGGSANNNLSTGTIHIAGVPANAGIVAAYLYWETIAAPNPTPADTYAH